MCTESRSILWRCLAEARERRLVASGGTNGRRHAACTLVIVRSGIKASPHPILVRRTKQGLVPGFSACPLSLSNVAGLPELVLTSALHSLLSCSLSTYIIVLQSRLNLLVLLSNKLLFQLKQMPWDIYKWNFAKEGCLDNIKRSKDVPVVKMIIMLIPLHSYASLKFFLGSIQHLNHPYTFQTF